MMKRCNKHERDIKEIILCFYDRVDKFVISGEVVYLTSRDVQLIFGVSGGKSIFHLTELTI